MAYLETDANLNLGGNGSNMIAVPYMPYGYGMGGYGNGGFFGGDGIWAIVLLALLFGNGGFGGFGGFGGGLGLADGGLLGYAIGNNATKGDVSDGFNSLHLSNQIEGVRDGVSTLSNQICNSTASVNQALTNGFYNAEISNNNRAINQMQDTFALSRQFADCCCENRLATQDLKATVISENCADREALSNGIRDIIASNTANTRAILDKLCSQEIEAKNDQIAQLRTQLNMADLRASQTAQTALIREGQIAEIDALYNRLSNCPVGTVPVYGSQPIFTCPNNNNNGCGCGLGLN